MKSQRTWGCPHVPLRLWCLPHANAGVVSIGLGLAISLHAGMKLTSSIMQPCDAGVIASTPAVAPCPGNAAPWVLAATILGSSLAFIDGTVVNVALPALQADLNATVVDVQWIIEAYALLLAALLLVGGSLGDIYG